MNQLLKRLVRPVAVLACWGMLAVAGAHAEDDPPGRVGRIAEFRGQVWTLEPEQGEWTDAVRNRPLTTGDRVATDRDGRLELQIGSTTVRLAERSDLELTRVDDDRIELTLHAGAAAVRVREPEIASELQITTPEGRFLPRGPGLFRIDRADRGSLAAAYSGEVQFDSPDSALTLRPGQRAELWLDPADRRTHYTWAATANDEFDRWVRIDDRRDMRLAEQRPVSPEMTGADDLDRYGQWDTHPEYGTVWYPSSVQVGWAPYRYGHWAVVGAWGWTWIDDAPWGFAPFHYGRWVNWRGRWGWVPGVYVRRPVYAPAMVAWVGGSHLSVGISVGGRPGPAVGWVPLAPREVYVPVYRTSPRYWDRVNHPYGVPVMPQRPAPTGRPVMYTNQGVPGGVTAVPATVLTQRQPVGTAQRLPDDQVMRAIRAPGATVQAAPPPVPQPAANAAVTRNPTAGRVLKAPWEARGLAAEGGPSQAGAVQAAPRAQPEPAPRGVTPVPVNPVPRDAQSQPVRPAPPVAMSPAQPGPQMPQQPPAAQAPRLPPPAVQGPGPQVTQPAPVRPVPPPVSPSPEGTVPQPAVRGGREPLTPEQQQQREQLREQRQHQRELQQQQRESQQPGREMQPQPPLPQPPQQMAPPAQRDPQREADPRREREKEKRREREARRES